MLSINDQMLPLIAVSHPHGIQSCGAGEERGVFFGGEQEGEVVVWTGPRFELRIGLADVGVESFVPDEAGFGAVGGI